MGLEPSAKFPFRLDDAILVLERTPGTLRGMVSGLSHDWLHGNCGAETFSPFDVLGHLIQGEKTDWMPRLRLVLEKGESEAFVPFDRFAQYVTDQGKRIEELLAEFTRLRTANVARLRSYKLDEAKLALRGMHPELGSVTVKELLATWVVHDLNHVKQIARTMAWQYRDEVGPWKQYLPVLA